MPLLTIAVLRDFPEEGWPSMDLVADMLLDSWRTSFAAQVRGVDVCPAYRRRFGRFPLVGPTKLAANADRLSNRWVDYPRQLRRRRGEFDCFHICDHSYVHLGWSLPAERTGVYCHDLDAFRCVLDPTSELRSAWFRALTRRSLQALQRSAVVFYSTEAVRAQLEQHALVQPGRLVHAPYGVSPEFTPDVSAEDVLAPLYKAPFVLHVGSCIPRKRIDVLLDVAAGISLNNGTFSLLQVGGSWTPTQLQQIQRLGIGSRVVQLRGLDRKTLAALYRRAAVVLLPSAAEGFGLPLIEALACGAIVVASDLPVLREVGGSAAVYCPVADRAAWISTVWRLVQQPSLAPTRAVRLERARRYTWREHGRIILEAYQRLR